MHDRELKLSETLRDFPRLFKTFKYQKVHEFNEVLYGKYEVLHGKDEILHRKDEVLWIRCVLRGINDESVAFEKNLFFTFVRRI